MEKTRDLLRILTDKLVPAVGTRHSLTVSDGFEHVQDMPNVNLALTLSLEEGRVLVFLTDDDLKLELNELVEVIEDLIDNDKA